MKSGIIDIFVDAFGWVMGKAGLFALAVLTGLGIGGLGLWAGTMTGGGSFGFQAGKPVFGHLTWVGAILPQILLLFWAGMIFVRSEAAEAKHWSGVVVAQALLLTACCSDAMPDGWLPRAAAWSVAGVGIAAVVMGVRMLEGLLRRRGEAHLANLEALNARRREELKEKFGIESASARELGLF